MAYGQEFAGVYDAFTGDADYARRAARQLSLLKAHGIENGILLDLACGTGTLTACYLDAGYDVIAVDRSVDMLMHAREKLAGYGDRALFLCQDMLALDLYGTVRATLCSLDAVNHLLREADVLKAFSLVSLFTEPGGVFIFDVNTVYKHRKILGDNTFVLEDDETYLVWQNALDPETDTVEMALDIFSLQDDGTYLRSTDEITERAYPAETLERLLREAGFSQVKVYGDLTASPPAAEAERICFLAVK